MLLRYFRFLLNSKNNPRQCNHILDNNSNQFNYFSLTSKSKQRNKFNIDKEENKYFNERQRKERSLINKMMEMEDIKNIFQNAEELANFGRRQDAVNRYSQFIDIVEYRLKALLPEEQQPIKKNLQEQLALAYNNRGHLRYLSVDFPEAVIDYTAGLQHSKLPVTYYNRGLIYYRLGNFDKAINDMQEALHLDPNFESAEHCLNQSTKDKKTCELKKQNIMTNQESSTSPF